MVSREWQDKPIVREGGLKVRKASAPALWGYDLVLRILWLPSAPRVTAST